MRYTAEQRLQAAQWFFDIHDAEDPGRELLQEWLQWLDACEGNRLAFEAVEAAYRQVPAGLMRVPDSGSSDTYDGSVPVAEWSLGRRQWGRGDVRRFARAAVLLMTLLGVGWWQFTAKRSHLSAGEFRTGTGEHLQLTLADGSRVDLGARSILNVSFSVHARDVRLVAGEAFFQVHKDAARAFRVHALEGLITAVGTAFDVRATADRVTVTVSEGVVDVANASEPVPDARDLARSLGSHSTLAHRINLSPGEQCSFTESPTSLELATLAVTRVDPADPARWREGWLVYRDEPLRDVIADVQRYTEREIAIADSVPTDLHFTGAVSRDSVIEWLRALPQVFPVTVHEQGPRLLVLAAGNSVTATSR